MPNHSKVIGVQLVRRVVSFASCTVEVPADIADDEVQGIVDALHRNESDNLLYREVPECTKQTWTSDGDVADAGFPNFRATRCDGGWVVLDLLPDQEAEMTAAYLEAGRGRRKVNRLSVPHRSE